MTALIEHIRRYPVKGLSQDDMVAVHLNASETLPSDRRFALALGSTPVSGATSEWMPKTRFLALVKHEKLAALETAYDDEAETLTVLRQGRQVARGKLTDRAGRSMIEDFFAAYMGEAARGRPKLVERVPDGVLTDNPDPLVSIINLATVRDLERVVKAQVDPRRFRGNFYIDGIDAWGEFDWVGRQVTIGDAVLEVTDRIDRCAATGVNPVTAERDINIVKSLQMGFGHIDLGVFAKVIKGGAVKVGDKIAPA